MIPSALGEAPAQRVALFVDTQNLYYAARDLGSAVDYDTLLKAALRGRQLAAASAYVVERDGDATAYAFYGKLNALGYRVRRLKLRVHRTDGDGGPLMEGNWDMGIAADMFRSFEHVDVVALASGDADFVPVLELAQERGLRAEALGFKAAAAQTLQDAVDRYVELSDVPGIFLPQRNHDHSGG